MLRLIFLISLCGFGFGQDVTTCKSCTCTQWQCQQCGKPTPNPDPIDPIQPQCTSKGSELPAGQSLSANECLVNGRFTAIMKSDGNLAVTGGTQWSTSDKWIAGMKESSSGPYKLLLDQEKGLRIVNSDTYPIWSTLTFKRSVAAAKLVLEKNGDLIVMDDNGRAMWSSSNNKPIPYDYIGEILANDMIMVAGECLESRSGRNKACLLENGNFVLTGTQPWTSRTADEGDSPRYLHLTATNNLVLLDYNGNRLWCAPSRPQGTQGTGTLRLSDDGSLVLIAGRQLWKANDGKDSKQCQSVITNRKFRG